MQSKKEDCACHQGLCRVTGHHCDMIPLKPSDYKRLCSGQVLINEAQSKLDVAESKLEALERLLSNPATQFYMSLNGKMLVTKMREILKGVTK